MARQFFESFNQKQMEEYETETGNAIPNVESLRTDQSPFEVRAQVEARETAEGMFFSQGTVELGDGAFTNFYDLSSQTESSSATPEVVTKNNPTSLKRLLVNDEKMVGAINAGFFHLADEGEYRPVDPTYNLCVRERAVIGLPVSDRPVLYSTEKGLEAKDIQARGTIAIGSDEYQWAGARIAHEGVEPNNAVTLYNSSCCTVRHTHSDETGTKRVLDEDLNFTPVDKDVFDVVVLGDDSGVLRIKEVLTGGGANLFAGNFILQVRGGEMGHFRVGVRYPFLKSHILNK